LEYYYDIIYTLIRQELHSKKRGALSKTYNCRNSCCPARQVSREMTTALFGYVIYCFLCSVSH